MHARRLIAEERPDAISPDAGIVQEAAVGRADRHDRDDRRSRPHRLHRGLDGLHDGGRHGRLRSLHRGAGGPHLDAVVGQHPHQGLVDVGDGFSGQDPAIDRRTGALRQRVGRVARIEHGGHAGGARHGIDAGRIRLETLERGGIGRRSEQGVDVRRLVLVAVEPGDLLEVVARRLVQVDGEIEPGQPAQAVGQVVDGVVARRPGAVPAGVRHLEFVGDEHLLADLQAVVDRSALAVELAEAGFVQRKLGVDQRAMLLEQVGHTVERRGDDLLVAGQRHDDVAPGHPPLLLEADQVVDVAGRMRLVVDHPASVVEAVLLHELERVARPVLAPGFDHVQVRQQQQRPLLAGAFQANHQVALGRAAGRHDQAHLGIAVARLLQACRHRGGRDRATARGVRRVDFHELLEDVVETADVLPVRRFVREGLAATAGERQRDE